MRLSSLVGFLLAFGLAGIFAFFAASFAARTVEDQSKQAIDFVLAVEGKDFAQVQTDGLLVILSGEAPNEADRFAAISLAGTVVDAARILDNMSVADAAEIAAPRFSVEMLRNDGGMTLIGLVPSEMELERPLARLTRALDAVDVTDLLERADYPAPPGWEPALNFGFVAAELLPRAKISVAAGQVGVEAIADSLEERQTWERRLRDRRPDGVVASLKISAPRPVITPFTLRFLIDETGPRFDACTADTQTAARRIRAAATQAGISGTPPCVIALGVPTATWADAATQSIAALSELGQGTLTITDGDISLIAAETTDAALFDRVTSQLEANLPELFSLTAVLPEPVEEGDDGPPEFLATLSPEGDVQLRGLVLDDLSDEVIESFARAQFDAERVYNATRTSDTVPEGWAIRAMAGLEALGELNNGSVIVAPDSVTLRGVTGNDQANARISQILSGRLEDGAVFSIDVSYDKRLDPLAALLRPDECMAEITALTDANKITFEPGSATLDSTSRDTITAIAEVIENCLELEIEIGGHTDSQGREEMNQALSQERANAVLAALLNARVVNAKFTARGFGETAPIADNDTEEGREANRRIVFTQLGPSAATSDADTPTDEAVETETPNEAEEATPTEEGTSSE